MSNDFLSQEEINALLNGKLDEKDKPEDKEEPNSQEQLEDKGRVQDKLDDKVNEQNNVKTQNNEDIDFELDTNQKDLLGEVGNISMGSASTALSQILNQEVLITTPQVHVTTLKELKDSFEIPNVSVEVNYISGISGENILVMKVSDAAIIANLMMGGDGKNVAQENQLSEIEESAVLEAMNQMIGSSATSMATMLAREINISPPKSKIWEDQTTPLADGIKDEDKIVKVAFRLTVGDLIDSHIMQIFPVNTALKVINIMMGNPEDQPPQQISQQPIEEPVKQTKEENINNSAKDLQKSVNNKGDSMSSFNSNENEFIQQKPMQSNNPKVEVKKANFVPLKNVEVNDMPKNIDLILDVPLEISVVLGKTRMKIKDILNLGSGSLIELDKLAEEPVEVLVNGKVIAYGEVVVVDENFGVRITSIVSNEERVKSLR